MSNRSQLSVLMATYHGESPNFLRDCLVSIQDQTLPPDEIVIVEDGPLGEELDNVIRQFWQLPIKLIRYEGKAKLGGALRLGVEHCSYSIVARMDSDDIAVPHRLEKQLEFLQKSGADIIGAAIEEFDSTIGDLGNIRCGCAEVTTAIASKANPLCHMTVMFKKQVVIDCGNYISLEGFEDWYLWLRALKRGALIMNLDDVLVHARTGNDFYKRRSGFTYFCNEIKALHTFYKHGLISKLNFIRGLCFRVPLRLLPQRVLSLIYMKFLRSHK